MKTHSMHVGNEGYVEFEVRLLVAIQGQGQGQVGPTAWTICLLLLRPCLLL